MALGTAVVAAVGMDCGNIVEVEPPDPDRVKLPNTASGIVAVTLIWSMRVLLTHTNLFIDGLRSHWRKYGGG